jgi:hypothetical protein
MGEWNIPALKCLGNSPREFNRHLSLFFQHHEFFTAILINLGLSSKCMERERKMEITQIQSPGLRAAPLLP